MRRHLRAVVLSAAFAFVSCTNDTTVTQPPNQPYVTPTGLVTANPPEVFTGAGDIASCSSTGDEATALLLDNVPGTIYNLGDNTYPDGTDQEFNNCYHPTWGRQKARTHPSTGNHEYNTSGASGYFNYFGAAAGDPTKGYYSYNLGAWHIVVLNSSISRSPGSAQDTWLRDDLAANPNLCTLAYWHHALYGSDEGSGTGGSVYTSMQPYWDRLYPAGAEIVLNGHRHFYERLAPMKPDGTADPQYGIREFIVGSGGIGGANITTNLWPTSESVNGDTRGVLKLYLYDDSYAWKFMPIAGMTFTDSGSTACHGAPGGGGTGNVSGANSTLSAAPAAITASSGSSLSTITVTAKDGNGNPVSGATVVLSATGTGNTLTQPTSTTSSSGVATGTLSSTKAESKIVSATISGVAVTQTATVTVGTAPPAALAFAVQPSNTAAGQAISPAVQVEIRDQFGNRTSATNSVTVAIGTNPAGGTLSGTSAVAAVNGVATFSTLSIDKAGTGYTLAASSGTLTGATSAAFNITAATATHLAFTQQPSNATAGVAISPAVKVTALDASGNVATGFTGAVSLSIASGPSGATLTGATVNAVSGVATFSSLSVDKAGTGYTLSALAGALTGPASTAFDVAPGAPSKLVFSQQPTTTVSGATIAPAVQVQILDQAGNATTATNAVTMGIGTNPAGGTLSGTTSVAAVSGVATFSTLSIDKAGTGYTLTASATGLTGAASTAFNVTAVAISAGLSTMSASPTSITAGSASTVTVTAKDASGNPVSGATVVLSATGTGNTLTQPSSTTNSSGVATGSLSSTVVGTKTVSAAINGVTITQTATVTVGTAAPATLAFTTQPSNALSGAAISPAPAVEIRDQYGNKTTATNTVTLGIGTNPAGGTLSGTTSVAAVNGVATFSTLSIDKAGTGYTLTASATGLSGATSTTFNITAGSVSAALSTVSASPTSITASTGSSVTTISVTARDAGGNPVSGATVVLSVTGTGNSLTQPSGTTNSSGVATGNLSSTVAESKTVTATINGTGITQSSTVTVTAAAAAGLAFAVQPSTTPAAATIAPAVQVEIRDQFGNRTNATTTIVMAIGTNPAGGALSGTTSVAAVNGVATFSDLSINQPGTGYTLTADDLATKKRGKLSSLYPAITSTPFDVVVGSSVSASLSTVSVSPTSVTAGTASTITVTAKDGSGNPVSGATVVLAATGTGNTLTQPSSTTNSSGVATGTLSSTVAGAKTVSATINGVAVTQTASVTVGAAAPAALAFTTQPSNTTAGSNLSPAPVVEIRDQFGNRVTSATNNVTMAIGTNPGGGTLAGTTTVAAASGVATFSTMNIDKAGAGYTLTASATGLTSATSAAFSVSAGAAAALGFTVQPSNVVAGQAISPAVQAEIRDQFGNRTSATNTVTIAIGTNPGGGSLSGTTSVAAVNGVATFSSLSIDKAGTGYTLTASATGLSGATSTAFTVTASAISAALSTVSASPPSVTAGTASTITVTAKDASGNPVSGATVVLSATGTGNTLTQPASTTNASGVATGTLSSTVAGTKTVSATISGVAVTQTAAVTVSAAAPAALAFTTQPSSTTAGATIAPAPVVELRDAFGNKTSATNTVAMAIGTNPGGGTLSGTLSVAAVNGVATFSTLSIDKAGSGYTLVAAAAGLTGATSTAFTVTSVAISASLSTVSASPTSISASSGAVVSTITVTAKDVNGNLVSGATVVLGATGTGNTLTQPSATTNGSGVASGTVSSTVAGSKTVSATINGVAITQTATVTVSAAAPAALAFTTQPSNALVGATISPAPVVELRDAFGNKTSATNTVAMAIGTNPGGGILSGTLSVAAVNGVATFSSLSIDKAGTGYTLVASSTGLTSATSAAFTISSSATPVSVTNVETIMKTSNTTSYALSTHTLTAGRLYVLAVETRVASGSPDVPTISGTTAGWTLQGSSLYFGVATNDARLSLFTAVPSATETSTITIGLGSVSQTHCSITLVEVQGQDASYAAQSPGFAKLDAGMATSLPVSVASTPAAGNVMLATYIHYGVAEDVVPDGTFTELGQSSGGGTLGDATTVEASYRVGGQQTATARWATSSYGAAVLFEIRKKP